MKRFWCKTCQRTKRVRRLPDDVVPLTDGNKIVGYSEGTCDYHDRGVQTRAQVMGRVRVLSHIVNRKKISASSAKSKSKK